MQIFYELLEEYKVRYFITQKNDESRYLIIFETGQRSRPVHYTPQKQAAAAIHAGWHLGPAWC